MLVEPIQLASTWFGEPGGIGMVFGALVVLLILLAAALFISVRLVSRRRWSEDIREVASQVAGAPRFALQRFRPGRCLDPDVSADSVWEAAVFDELAGESHGRQQELLFSGNLSRVA